MPISRARWRLLAAVDTFWLVAGTPIFVQGLDCVLYFPLAMFGFLMLVGDCTR